MYIKREKVNNRKDNVVRAAGNKLDLTEVRVTTGTFDKTVDYIEIKIDPPLLVIAPVEGLAKIVEIPDISLKSGQKNLKKRLRQ